MPLPNSKTYTLNIDQEKWASMPFRSRGDGTPAPGSVEASVDEIFNKFPYPSPLPEIRRAEYTAYQKAIISIYLNNPWKTGTYNLFYTNDAFSDQTGVKVKTQIKAV